jgi:hypothetical protein
MTYLVNKNAVPSPPYLALATVAVAAAAGWFLGVYMTAAVCMGAM